MLSNRLDNRQIDKSLRRELDELRLRYPGLKPDNLFVLWFLRAYITEQDDQAARAIVGGPDDAGFDSIFFDEQARMVFVIQAKRRAQTGARENPKELSEFVNSSIAAFSENKKSYEDLLSRAGPRVKGQLQQARDAVHRRKYRVRLYYVTTGLLSQTSGEDAQRRVKAALEQANIEAIGARELGLIIKDYLDGVAPPVPSAELELEPGVSEILQRYDKSTKIEAWVFSVHGEAIADLYRRSGLRLFARNIRGFLGFSTSINKAMRDTLENEPENFFYYNNGITIVCDKAERLSERGAHVMRMWNPQVINGQQTVRTLAEKPHTVSLASVLIKVIQVPRDFMSSSKEYDGLIGSIVQATNWQNKITASDLRSNDRIQIDIERSLRKLGYLYLRKRQSKAEARTAAGASHHISVSKEELALAIAGSELDPREARSGKEHLFEKDTYGKIFRSADPNFFLPRYWLAKTVSRVARGSPEKGYAKWLILWSLWAHLNPILRSAVVTTVFRESCEQNSPKVMKPLTRIMKKLFAVARKYYVLNRGKGASTIDVSRFYRDRRGHHVNFSRFLATRQNARVRSGIRRELARLQEALRS